MAKTIDLDGLAKRARRACDRLRFDPGDASAASLRRLFAEVAGDPRVNPSRDFTTAKAAVDAWASAEDLRDTAIRLYHDPRVRAIAGSQEVLDYYWQHPGEAMEVLGRHSVEYPESYQRGPVKEVMETIAAVESFYETHSSGPELPEVAPPPPDAVTEPVPGPSRAAHPGTPKAGHKPPGSVQGAGGSYDELIAKDKLSNAEYAQLVAWAEEDQAIEDNTLPETYHESSSGDGETEN